MMLTDSRDEVKPITLSDDIISSFLLLPFFTTLMVCVCVCVCVAGNCTRDSASSEKINLSEPKNEWNSRC